jgi:hypothetical protein
MQPTQHHPHPNLPPEGEGVFNILGSSSPPFQGEVRRNVEQGSALRGAGSPESGRGAPVIFGDLTSQAIVGGDPLRLTRVASPINGAPAPPRQPPRLRDATVEPIKGASFQCRSPARLRGQIPRGAPLPPLDAPRFPGMRPWRRTQARGQSRRCIPLRGRIQAQNAWNLLRPQRAQGGGGSKIQ